MTRRRAAAEATRQRIVKAAFDVHGEQGIAGARLEDIAAAAGTSLATLYRHFPRYEDLVGACGDLTFELFPLPTAAEAAEALRGVRGRRRRIERLVERLHAFYEQTGPTVEMMRADAAALPVLAERLQILDAGIRAWVHEALPDVPEPARTTVRALVDHRVWTALTAGDVPDPRGTVVRIVEAVVR